MNSANPNPTSSSAAQPLAIEATGLTKRFGQLLAVDRLDLSVPAGTVFSLLGPNGSGKTTTVRMLATLLAPDAGSARVNGYDIRTEGAKVRSVISLTGQFAALDPNLTARENLVLMARLRGHGRTDSGRIADALLERFLAPGQAAIRRTAPPHRSRRRPDRQTHAAGARRADHRS